MATLAKASAAPRKLTSTLASASAGPFPLGFRIFDDDGFEVYVNDILIAPSAYTISATFSNGFDDAAAITFDTALEIGDELIVYGKMVADRESDIGNGASNIVAQLNIELARQAAMIQELQRDMARAILTISGNPNPLPPVSDRASKAAVFDAEGNVVAGELADPGELIVTPFIETLLDDTNASTSRATLGLGSLATKGPDALSLFCTTAGSANAVELTSGFSLSAHVTGMKIRFIPDSNNTGSTTVDLDGIGPVTCKTITGSNLPADYLRASVMSECWYNGTNIIVDRLPEYGSNAAGKYWRYANGNAIAIAEYANLSVNVAGAVGFRNSGETKNMPITFAEIPNGSGSSSDTTYVWINARASSSSEWTIGAFSATSQTGVDVNLIATGRWYS